MFSRNGRDGRIIGRYDMEGNLLATYETLRLVEEEYFDKSAVWACCTNQKWRKTHKGFIWRYLDDSKIN